MRGRGHNVNNSRLNSLDVDRDKYGQSSIQEVEENFETSGFGFSK